MSYHSREELIDLFLELESRYPIFVSHELFGKTYEDRDIYIFKIGNPFGGRVMFDGSCHGNERATSEALYLYAKWLLESKTNEAMRILKNNLTIIVPIVNMDGFPTHRKNMNFEPPRVDGVDLNRNFDWNWAGEATTGGGVSDDPTSSVYRGPYPLSEPETILYKKIWEKFRPIHYLNCHTGARKQIWYIRWPTQSDRDYVLGVYDTYVNLAEKMGVSSFPISEDGGTGNFNSTPYHEYGIYGWSCELHEKVGANPPYEELPALLDEWLPFFITLSRESEALTGPLGIWKFPLINWVSGLFPNIYSRAHMILENIKSRIGKI